MPCFTPTQMVIDWSILRCGCNLDLRVDSGPSAEFTRHFQLLPCQHLPDYCRPKWVQHLAFPPCFPSPILSTKLCHLGERSLVLEPGDKPYMCSACNLPAAMGTKISKGHPVALQFTQASTNSCVLRRRRREASPSMGGRNLAHASSHFPLPVLRRPCRVPMQCEYYDFQVGVVMGWHLHGSVRMHHIDANLSS